MDVANDPHHDGSANLLSSPSRHWKLCEIIAAVRACLAVQERSGDSSTSDGKPHVDKAYALMCKQLQSEVKWDDILTVEQSIKDSQESLAVSHPGQSANEIVLRLFFLKINFPTKSQNSREQE